jgi:hypothetical protein
LRQEQIDRGDISGTSTDTALDLAAAKRRIRQLETELSVSRKASEAFLERGCLHCSTRYRLVDRAGKQRARPVPFWAQEPARYGRCGV